MSKSKTYWTRKVAELAEQSSLDGKTTDNENNRASTEDLNKLHIATLLSDMESLGIERKSIKLKHITDLSKEKQAFYRKNLRTAFRRKLQTFRNQSSEKYLETLGKWQVDPGKTFHKELAGIANGTNDPGNDAGKDDDNATKDSDDADDKVDDTEEKNKEDVGDDFLEVDNDSMFGDEDDTEETEENNKKEDVQESKPSDGAITSERASNTDAALESLVSTLKKVTIASPPTYPGSKNVPPTQPPSPQNLSTNSNKSSVGSKNVPANTPTHPPSAQNLSTNSNKSSVPTCVPIAASQRRTPPRQQNLSRHTILTGHTTPPRAQNPPFTGWFSPSPVAPNVAVLSSHTTMSQGDATNTPTMGNLSSPPPMPSSLRGSLSMASVTTSLDEEDAWKGSRLNPFIVLADPKRAQCVAESFKIAFVPTMKHHGLSRPAFHISKTYNVIDASLVKAEIPKVGEFPDYEGRCFLVAEPSLDLWARKAKLFHSGQAVVCDSTLTANEGIQTDWDNNKSLQTKWHLIILPEAINNTHFSQSSDSAIPTFEDVTILPKAYEGNDTGEDVVGNIAYWELACDQGGHKLTNENKATPKTRAQRLAEMRNGVTNAVVV